MTDCDMLLTSVKLLLNPYILPMALLVGGFAAFKMSAPACQPISEAAHIFVLTGDARRIPFALEKLEGYPRRKLYVIGAGTPKLDTRFGAQIEVESVSKTTYENAVAIRKIAHRKLLGNIVLITTADHINRSVFLVKKELPLIKINACPVPLSNMPATKRLERWIGEYMKFLGSLVGITERGGKRR